MVALTQGLHQVGTTITQLQEATRTQGELWAGKKPHEHVTCVFLGGCGDFCAVRQTPGTGSEASTRHL